MTKRETIEPRRRRPAAKTDRWAWAAPLMALAGCSPAGLLTGVDRLSSASEARRVATGEPYATGARQKLDIWAPRRVAAGTSLRVVVFFYGGAWAEGSRRDYGFAGAAYASRGFIAVVPDYRLVPEVRFPGFVEDGAAAMRWVEHNISRYGGDPKRVTVAGHLAGAYIAAMLALNPHYLRDVGASPKLVRAAALLAAPLDFYPFTAARGQAAFGHWPKPQETQPITFVSSGAPPIFLAHGTDDRVVGSRNSKHLAERLKAAGDEVELRLYPGASHVDLASSLSRPFRNRTPVLADSADFLLKHSR